MSVLRLKIKWHGQAGAEPLVDTRAFGGYREATHSHSPPNYMSPPAFHYSPRRSAPSQYEKKHAEIQKKNKQGPKKKDQFIGWNRQPRRKFYGTPISRLRILAVAILGGDQDLPPLQEDDFWVPILSVSGGVHRISMGF